MPDSNEFESISKRIQGQLGAPNHRAAAARDRANEQRDVITQLRDEMQELAKSIKKSTDDSLTTKILEEKNQLVKKLLDKEIYGLGRSPKSPAPVPNRIKFRVPKGTTILHFGKRHPPSGVMVRHGDFEMYVTSVAVAYDLVDVIMDPTTGRCDIDSLRSSVYFADGQYFAFKLPPNDKNVPFILVPLEAVLIKKSPEPMADKAAEIKQFLDDIFNQID
ncbi:hypothetical protein LCGC14_1314830 [marine sediment metagenome]|uniref:Uncharacterized protein n=1 Tax=marine sediment metagenome TaxID=412755 RepID=A0A0F9NNM3_9ZZZZ